MGRLSVFGFKIYDTQPKPKPLSFPANYYKFQIKSNKISSRSSPNPSRSCEISPLSDEISVRSVISVQSRWSQPDFDPSDKTRGQLESTRNRQDPNQKIWPNPLGQFRVKISIHLNHSCWVQVGHKPNPTWSVNNPTSDYQIYIIITFSFFLSFLFIYLFIYFLLKYIIIII